MELVLDKHIEEQLGFVLVKHELPEHVSLCLTL